MIKVIFYLRMRDSTSPPVELDAGKVRLALGDPDTMGLVLFTIALSNFGPAVLGDPDEGIDPMDPAEMWAEFNERYGTWVTEEGENRLNAITTGLADGRFWKDLPTFMAVATALFDGDLGDLITTGFSDLGTTELMWAVMEMNLIWDADETPEFSLDVQQFIEDALLEEQDDTEQSAREIEQVYLSMLDQLHETGVPASMIRVWDEEYSEVMENLGDGQV